MTIIFTLLFDSATEHAIRQIWQQIADAGIEVAGITGHRPHISLAAYDSDDVAQYHADLQNFVVAQPTIPIRFHHLGIFPEAGVVFLAPRVTQALLTLHSGLLTHLEGEQRVALKFPHHMAKGAWTPHCTLVVGVPPADFAQVVSICNQNWAAIEGMVEGIGMLVLPAPRKVDLYQYRFGNASVE